MLIKIFYFLSNVVYQKKTAVIISHKYNYDLINISLLEVSSGHGVVGVGFM